LRINLEVSHARAFDVPPAEIYMFFDDESQFGKNIVDKDGKKALLSFSKAWKQGALPPEVILGQQVSFQAVLVVPNAIFEPDFSPPLIREGWPDASARGAVIAARSGNYIRCGLGSGFMDINLADGKPRIQVEDDDCFWVQKWAIIVPVPFAPSRKLFEFNAHVGHRAPR
jgi:hypothetical protein